MLRLTQATDGATWKAYAMYTSLQELKSVQEPLGKRRTAGTTESMPGGLAGGTWIERRRRKIEFDDEEPTTLVVGAGKRSQGSVELFSRVLIQWNRSSWSEYGYEAAESGGILSDC